MSRKIHPKGIIFGVIGGIATLVGSVILTINGMKIGFDKGVDSTLDTMKKVSPQMHEDFCESVNIPY